MLYFNYYNMEQYGIIYKTTNLVNGKLSMLRVYGRPLSPLEVKDLYDLDKGELTLTSSLRKVSLD